ncbi:porin family protein [Martelella sp. HB161492]|uniref:outer membrane protein n=1 Tax=Martelella sp. HB161492 TaxID=2720726 RepID=UPI001591ADAF|nr:porin family protein [Martelella sp. HB161492]
MATAAFLSSVTLSMAQELPDSLKPIGNLSGPYNLLIPNYENAPVMSSWTGFYIKPNIGYGEISYDNSLLKNDDGFTLGVSGGYDFLKGHLLFGPRVDVNYDFFDGSASSNGGPYRYKAFTDLDGSVGGRIGYIWKRTLLYATGGYAFANTSVKNDTLAISDAKFMSGWTAGGGVEYLWSNTNGLRLEYRRVEFPSEKFDILPAGNDSVSASMNKISVSFVRRF